MCTHAAHAPRLLCLYYTHHGPGRCGRYAPTLRTSAARALCALCPKFVAQTATPRRRFEAQLLAWLADTCAFPVTASNMLVAASAMVLIQLEPLLPLGITATVLSYSAATSATCPS